MSRLLSFDKLNNTRDLGGMQTMDGRTVRSGMLIRSGHLFFASEQDIESLEKLVDTVVDFRTDQEIFEKPDPSLEDVTYHHIPILSSWTAGVTWEEKEDVSEEEVMDKLRRNETLSLQYMQGIYQGFVSNPYYISQYRKFVDLLLEPRKKALLWHCTAGKDRAGFATVIVEELLGISRETIIADYLMTGEYLAAEIDYLVNMLQKEFENRGGVSENAMRNLFGAKKEFLEATYQKVEEMYSTFDVFLKDALKVTAEEKETIRNRYLEG